MLIIVFLGVFTAACVALATQSGGAAASQVTGPSQPVGDPAVRRCRSVTPETYNRYVRKLDRIERLNPYDLPNRRHKRATRKVCKHGPYERLRDRLEQVCRAIHVVTGRVSVFTDGTTASGADASETEGLAINTDPGTTSGWKNAQTARWMVRSPLFKVRLLGRERFTRAIDRGPAASTHRALDFTGPLARAMGFPASAFGFPTDSIGQLWRWLFGCEPR